METSSDTVTVRPAQEADMAAVCELVNHYIEHTSTNFRTEPRTTTQWIQELADNASHYPWLVADVAGTIAGLAYATSWKTRPAYAWTAETTIYIDTGYVGRGVGSTLYRELLETLQRQGFHSAIATITLPNDHSLTLHKSMGYLPVGTIANAGFKRGQWHDVTLWQRELSRAVAPPLPVTPFNELTE